MLGLFYAKKGPEKLDVLVCSFVIYFFHDIVRSAHKVTCGKCINAFRTTCTYMWFLDIASLPKFDYIKIANAKINNYHIWPPVPCFYLALASVRFL